MYAWNEGGTRYRSGSSAVPEPPATAVADSLARETEIGLERQPQTPVTVSSDPDPMNAVDDLADRGRVSSPSSTTSPSPTQSRQSGVSCPLSPALSSPVWTHTSPTSPTVPDSAHHRSVSPSAAAGQGAAESSIGQSSKSPWSLLAAVADPTSASTQRGSKSPSRSQRRRSKSPERRSERGAAVAERSRRSRSPRRRSLRNEGRRASQRSEVSTRRSGCNRDGGRKTRARPQSRRRRSTSRRRKRRKHQKARGRSASRRRARGRSRGEAQVPSPRSVQLQSVSRGGQSPSPSVLEGHAPTGRSRGRVGPALLTPRGDQLYARHGFQTFSALREGLVERPAIGSAARSAADLTVARPTDESLPAIVPVDNLPIATWAIGRRCTPYELAEKLAKSLLLSLFWFVEPQSRGCLFRHSTFCLTWPSAKNFQSKNAKQQRI